MFSPFDLSAPMLWLQMPLRFPKRHLAMKLARPRTLLGRAGRAARGAVRRVALALKTMQPSARAPIVPKVKGTLSNRRQLQLISTVREFVCTRWSEHGAPLNGRHIDRTVYAQ